MPAAFFPQAEHHKRGNEAEKNARKTCIIELCPTDIWLFIFAFLFHRRETIKRYGARHRAWWAERIGFAAGAGDEKT
jgi:hypothetical protein